MKRPASGVGMDLRCRNIPQIGTDKQDVEEIEKPFLQGKGSIASEVVVRAQGRSVNAAAKKQAELLFVTYTSQNDLDKRTTKAVRSHVMRQHVRKIRPQDELVEVDEDEQAVTNAKRPKYKLCLGEGRIDPFGTLSVTMTTGMSRLFDHFAQLLAGLHYPRGTNEVSNPMTTRWVPSAVKDDALLHSTLCSAAGHLCSLQGTPGPLLPTRSEYSAHKIEAIKIVNRRMNDLSLALTDSTIGAVALLVTDQSMEGNYEEMSMHMTGLAKLVNLRGGLGNLGMNGLLAAEIQWCDIVNAFSNSTPPLLALNHDHNLPEDFENPLLRQFSYSFTSTHLLDRRVIKILGTDLVDLFMQISTMTAMLHLKPILSESDMLIWDYRRASAQHGLVALPSSLFDANSAGTEESSAIWTTIQEIVRIAGVIYSCISLWGFQPPMQMFGDMAIKLQKPLRETDMNHSWGGGASRDLLLWALIMGGHAAFLRPERAWFVERLVEQSKKRRLAGFDEVKSILFKILCNEQLVWPFSGLWMEVEMATRISPTSSQS